MKNKGWFIACCISVLIAVVCCVFLTATHNMVLEKEQAEAEIEEINGIDISAYSKSDISRLEEELTKAKADYESTNEEDTSAEDVVREYIEKRYNFQGKNSDKCEEIVQSLSNIVSEEVAEDIRSEMSVHIGGTNMNVVTEITDHTGILLNLYRYEEKTEFVDNMSEEEAIARANGTYVEDTRATKNYYAEVYINDSQIYYILFTLKGETNDWTISEAFVRLTEFVGEGYYG